MGARPRVAPMRHREASVRSSTKLFRGRVPPPWVQAVLLSGSTRLRGGRTSPLIGRPKRLYSGYEDSGVNPRRRVRGGRAVGPANEALTERGVQPRSR